MSVVFSNAHTLVDTHACNLSILVILHLNLSGFFDLVHLSITNLTIVVLIMKLYLPILALKELHYVASVWLIDRLRLISRLISVWFFVLWKYRFAIGSALVAWCRLCVLNCSCLVEVCRVSRVIEIRFAHVIVVSSWIGVSLEMRFVKRHHSSYCASSKVRSVRSYLCLKTQHGALIIKDHGQELCFHWAVDRN